MNGSGADRPKGQLEEEAAEWFARMRSPNAESSRSEFEAWLARGALHRSAYNRASEIFAMGKLLSDDAVPPRAEESARGPRHLRRLASAGAAMLLALSAGTWVALRPAGEVRIAQNGSDLATGAAQLATAAGQRRQIRLGDGSLLILAADTRVEADFDDRLRGLTLEHGRARFQVAHEKRPFIVYAGGGSITARGTVFEVGLAADRRVSVRLIEGVVDVRVPRPQSAGGARAAQRRLHAGDTIDFTASGAPRLRQGSVKRTKDEPGSASAMAQAQEYQGIRVSELIALANRTSARPIRLSDKSIGERRISGRFRINDTDLLAERIAALFDLSVDQAGSDAIVLLPK